MWSIVMRFGEVLFKLMHMQTFTITITREGGKSQNNLLFNLLSTPVNHNRRGLILVTKLVNLVMETFDHTRIIFNIFLNNLSDKKKHSMKFLQ